MLVNSLVNYLDGQPALSKFLAKGTIAVRAVQERAVIAILDNAPSFARSSTDSGGRHWAGGHRIDQSRHGTTGIRSEPAGFPRCPPDETSASSVLALRIVLGDPSPPIHRPRENRLPGISPDPVTRRIASDIFHCTNQTGRPLKLLRRQHSQRVAHKDIGTIASRPGIAASHQ